MAGKSVNKRIEQIRIEKGVSESKMSLEMGEHCNYIHDICSGAHDPTIDELSDICEYFEITLNEFFDGSINNPILFHKAVEAVEKLDQNDLLTLIEQMIGLINKK